MNKNIFFMAIALTVAIVSSCSKLGTPNSKADPNSQQHNQDLNNTRSESDNLNTDIINVLKDVRGFGKTDETDVISICGATIDTSQQYASTPTVVINFDGTTVCGDPGRKRAGQVKIELIEGNKWTDAGAKLRITHTNYKVTFINLNSHYVTFNGVKYLTNLDGIDYIALYLSGGNLTARFRERSQNMNVTFENGQTDSWNFARLSTWQITNYTTITATVNGDSISGNKTIDSWGTTRFGTAFTTEVITPWKSGTACGWWKPTQGKYTSTTDDFTITATCGVDRNGNQASGCGGYGYKIEWDYKNGTAKGDAVIQYF
ncbi:MAG: hypothetical protein BGO32_00235 [Bacteroidetes bacterium 37-13]|nr:MAG: hypothetical protein BGO32_00235 [Bacteroidetes bacterium 37-13]